MIERLKVGAMCDRDLGFGKRCTGDVTKPATHAVECSRYVAVDPFVEKEEE